MLAVIEAIANGSSLLSSAMPVMGSAAALAALYVGATPSAPGAPVGQKTESNLESETDDH